MENLNFEDRQPIYIGYIACLISVILFGSNLAVVKKYDTGDGFFFNWVYCSAIWITGLIVNIWQNSPTFYPLALLGGFLWATGGLCVSLILKYIGLGLGLCIWATFNMIIGWACGRFGLFGIEKRLPHHLVLNYLSLLFSIISAFLYLSVRTDIAETEDLQHYINPNEILNSNRTLGPRDSCSTEASSHTAQPLLAHHQDDKTIFESQIDEEKNVVINENLENAKNKEYPISTKDNVFLDGETTQQNDANFNIPKQIEGEEGKKISEEIPNNESLFTNTAFLYDVIDPMREHYAPNNSNNYNINYNHIGNGENTIISLQRDQQIRSQAVQKKMKKRIIGSLLAIVAGCLYGVNFVPVIFIQDNYPHSSKRGLPYIFAHFSGIYLTATLYFLGYSAFKIFYNHEQPWIDSRMIMPTFVSGLLWSIATCAWFVANEILSQTVSFPIIASLPPIIAGLWALFVFHEIKGRRDIILLFIAFAFSLTGAILAGFSF